VLDINDKGRRLSLCYTGDLGRKNMPIIRDPYDVIDSDVLIIESTYGNRLHENIANIKERIAKVINETVAVGGKVLIPAFALERTQEIIYTFHQLRLEGKIPADIPIYVDSPLAIDATDVFRLHPECFDRQLQEFLLKVDDPFGFRNIYYTRNTEESMKLNESSIPMIIMAGSGMAEGGRILHHLKNNIENPNTTVLIVGWQAENTLGRKIAEKWREVSISAKCIASTHA
jgi:metallo-beta-lactamase family protein